MTKYSKISHTHSSELCTLYKAEKAKTLSLSSAFTAVGINIIWHHFIQPEQSFILTVSHSDLFKTKRA